MSGGQLDAIINDALRRVLAGVIEDASNELPGVARLALQRAHLHWIDIEVHLAWAVVAIVGDSTQFSNGRQSTCGGGRRRASTPPGGKASLGCIPKRGDDYLRPMLIQGSRSAAMSADKRCDRISCCLVQLKECAGWQKAVVAMANKNARIFWAVLTRGIDFDPDHVAETPAARLSPRPAVAG